MTRHIDLHIEIDDAACETLQAWMARAEAAQPTATSPAATRAPLSCINHRPALPLRQRVAAWATDRLYLLGVAVLFSCALIPLMLWLEHFQGFQTWSLLLGFGGLLMWLGGRLLISLCFGLFR